MMTEAPMGQYGQFFNSKKFIRPPEGYRLLKQGEFIPREFIEYHQCLASGRGGWSKLRARNSETPLTARHNKGLRAYAIKEAP